MRRAFFRIAWIVTLLLAAWGPGPPPLGATGGALLTTALERELGRAGSVAKHTGVHVVEVGSGRTVFARRADEPFILASNAKILTTAAALDGLGPGYFFETPLLARGRIDRSSRTLEGDLAVVGGGDPTISGRRHLGDPFGVFRRWAARLRLMGVERVAGDLILDHGLFPEPGRHPEWNPKNHYKWYQVPVDALGFYENVVRIRLIPDERPGGPARFELYPPVPFLEVTNRVRTLASRRGHGVDAVMGGDGSLRLDGGIYRGTDHIDTYLAMEDPVGWFGAALRASLETEGIHIDGRIRPVEELPGLGWRQVAVHRTDLLTVVEVTHRESQNFFAESLLRLLGAKLCGRGTWRRGSGGDDSHRRRAPYSLADGSGPHQPHVAAADDDRTTWREHGREFIRSLPHGGLERSSLEDRLTEPAYADNVFAKTGTLLGVTTLSGYAKGRSGRLYAFSILIRGGPVWRGRELQDALVRSLVDEG